jgi:dTDP-4-amino-4,6-dideoxygalactose transaminase
MSDVSARLGREQLPLLDSWCARRRQLVDIYFSLLEPHAERLGLSLPAQAHAGEYEGHSWNMFCVLLPLERMRITRKQFIDEMAGRQIGIGVSYEAMHLSTLFRNRGHRPGEFPNAERISRETITLPLFPSMTATDVERVCGAVRDILHLHGPT